MFYVSVSVIAFIILIVMLYYVRSKINSTTPASMPASTCPDYWYSSYYDVTGDPVKDEQLNPSSYGDELDRTLKCYNVKKLGSTTCSSSMDFSGDEWNGPDGLCKKKNWAKACGLTWDGVTTDSTECPLTKELEPVAPKVTDLIFKKMDNTNCIQGRVDSPGESTDSIKYLGAFDSYEECSQSSNIPSNAKAITYHNTSFTNGWGGQCFSVTDNNTNAVQDNITCGIVTDVESATLSLNEPVPKPFNIGSQQNTPGNEEGGGNALYLDRHDVSCSSGALNQLKLERKGDAQGNPDGNYRYDFTCTSGGSLGPSQDKTTPFNEDGGGNTVFLDRHDIKCDNNEVLTEIRLKRNEQNQYQYQYKCAPSSTKLTCRTDSTQWNSEGNGNAVYLDRHDIKCNNDEALSQVHLVRKGDAQGNPDGNYRYDYTCCSE